MRSVKTRHLRLVTQEHSVTIRTRSDVSSAFGPVSPGSTTLLAQETLRVNQLRQLTELLNSLESVVANLNYKSSTALDTLLTATQAVRVALSATPIDAAGTNETP
jgi:hypothetical protein